MTNTNQRATADPFEVRRKPGTRRNYTVEGINRLHCDDDLTDTLLG